jgi:hypothetical protein
VTPGPVLAAAAALSLGRAADAGECRLALVLALDISSSVDRAEDRLQREGLAGAILAPPVARAFLAGDPVAVYAFEWSGITGQAALLPGWEVVESEEDLRRVAEAIAGSRRSRSDLGTALGAALGHAWSVLGEAPACRARTVDVSGDGINNEGIRPGHAYASLPFQGVTVNALVIGGEKEDSQLVAWFRREVLHGPGAFLVHAAGFEDYQHAMESKLLRELEFPAVGGGFGAPGAAG